MSLYSRRLGEAAGASLGCGALILVLVVLLTISGVIGAICRPYTINSWLEYAGHEPGLLWWHGFLMGYVPGLGQASLPAAVLTWVLMMFLG